MNTAVTTAERRESRLPADEARRQLAGLLAGESDLIANSANFVAFLNTLLDDINWVGLYFLRGDELVLGPFQGRPACVRIALGKGVCGHCAASETAQRVDDVQAFPGHIACDIRSRSELVLPIHSGAALFAVLDIDSPSLARFTADDQRFVEVLRDEFVASQFA